MLIFKKTWQLNISKQHTRNFNFVSDSKSDLTDKISLASSTSSKSSEDTVTTASSSVFGAMKGQLIEQKRRRPLNDSEVAKFPQLPRGLKMEAVSKQPKFFGL